MLVVQNLAFFSYVFTCFVCYVIKGVDEILPELEKSNQDAPMDQNIYVGANPDIRMDQDIELGRMVAKAFGRCDELQGNIIDVGNRDDSPRIEGGNLDGGNGAVNLDFADVEVDVEANHEKTKAKMYKEAQTPFYEGCPISRLAFVLLLLNLVSM
jgi:hypothetical protein